MTPLDPIDFGLPAVYLKPGAERRIRAGHLWVFANELEYGFQSSAPGAVAELRDNRGRALGCGTVNPHSLIAMRLLTREREVIDHGFFLRRMREALHLRQRLLREEARVCRVVYSEADGLPGLIIDRFGDVCVVQSLTAGMENLLELVLDGLHELLAPKVIVLASDAPIRTLEGLELVRKVVHGRLDGYVEFEEDGIRLLADPVNGQKTGFFLDQRNNRRLIAEFVRPGDRAIDLFCYSGAFGLALLQRGAAHVTFMDSSESALALAREAVSRNEWLDRAEFVRADIFPYLKEPHEPYDIVVMDPPSLAKSRTKVPSALRAYRDLNARAISLVRPGGILATASCSGLVERVRWLKALTEAGLKAGRTLRRLAEGGQPPDHPVLSAMPETEYLKFAVFVVD